MVRKDVEELQATPPSEAVRLLPGHDQWVIGPGTQDQHVTPSSRRALMTRKANPVIGGGVVRGTWARKDHQLTVTWLDDRPTPGQLIEQEVDRLAHLVVTDLELTVTRGG